MLRVSGIIAVATDNIQKKKIDNGDIFYNFESVTRQRKDKKSYYYRKTSVFVPAKFEKKADELLQKGQMIHILSAEWKAPHSSSSSDTQNKGFHSLQTDWYSIAFLPYGLNEEKK